MLQLGQNKLLVYHSVFKQERRVTDLELTKLLLTWHRVGLSPFLLPAHPALPDHSFFCYLLFLWSPLYVYCQSSLVLSFMKTRRCLNYSNCNESWNQIVFGFQFCSLSKLFGLFCSHMNCKPSMSFSVENLGFLLGLHRISRSIWEEFTWSFILVLYNFNNVWSFISQIYPKNHEERGNILLMLRIWCFQFLVVLF